MITQENCVTSYHMDRKTKKPLMEKRRRARINACLVDLKSLLLDTLNQQHQASLDPSTSKPTTPSCLATSSKLEKADILELTCHLLRSKERSHLAASATTDPTTLQKFSQGWADCAGQVAHYANSVEGFNPEVRARLLTHLDSCYTSIETTRATLIPARCGRRPVGLQTPIPFSTALSEQSGGFAHLGTKPRMLPMPMGFSNVTALKLSPLMFPPPPLTAPWTATDRVSQTTVTIEQGGYRPEKLTSNLNGKQHFHTPARRMAVKRRLDESKDTGDPTKTKYSTARRNLFSAKTVDDTNCPGSDRDGESKSKIDKTMQHISNNEPTATSDVSSTDSEDEEVDVESDDIGGAKKSKNINGSMGPVIGVTPGGGLWRPW